VHQEIGGNVSRRVAIVVGIAIVIAGTVTGIVVSQNSPARKGTVTVLYAGSFSTLMSNDVDAAFHAATGYTIVGISNGSTALASEIKGGIEVGDVFISASTSADDDLAGAANGNWVSSYDVFGTSPLVLGYNPSSQFAAALRTKPWYSIVSESGFRLGRTDPATDPKGVLAVTALDDTATAQNLPELRTLAHSTSDVFAETSLVGELQSGQIDAGFFYAVEASAAHLSTVPLTGTDLAATYTIATLRGAPHTAAARAFVTFMETTGRQILSDNGVIPVSPAVEHTEP
jgi:molybdate/tungstate transport system substrate-binding protein